MTTTTAPTAPAQLARRYSTPLLTELDREWERLRHRPQALGRVRRWVTGGQLESISKLNDLDDLVRATQPDATAPGVCDEALRQLIVLAAEDELAGRIVLQRILPGLISRSRRWHHHANDQDPLDTAIAAAWIAIRSFDVDARSRHVAPSLISDALWIGFRRGSRRRSNSEVPVAGSVLASRPAPPNLASPIEALAGTLRAARRAGVPAVHLELIRGIAEAGSPSRAACRHNVTVRTIRNRRDAASWNIREALGPDWADWSDPLVVA